MQERHVERPAEIGETLYRRLADVPDQSVALREVARITHGDHGVVYEGEVALSFNVKRGADDEAQVGERGNYEDDLKRGTFGHKCWDYILRFGWQFTMMNGDKKSLFIVFIMVKIFYFFIADK
jgi:hypothetical protein